MPVYRDVTADPSAPPPKPITRALTGLDGFGTEKLDMYDMAKRISDHGLTQPIAEEYQIADEPNRKRIYDNVARAQDWYLGADDGQITDQNYAANLAPKSTGRRARPATATMITAVSVPCSPPP